MRTIKLNKKIRLGGCAAALLTIAGRALAGDASACAVIADNTERLACYDEAAGRPHKEAPPPQVAETSPFSARWELDAEDKKGTFLIKPYKPTYILLGRVSNSPNARPTSANPSNTVAAPPQSPCASALPPPRDPRPDPRSCHAPRAAWPDR